jgi:origin recognition complex subunit 1
MKIIQSRLEGVPGGIVEPDAIQFASRKVAAVSGDARRALDICRRAVELAEIENLQTDSVPTTPSKSKAFKGAAMPSARGGARVTIATIKRAINEATTSPLQQHLRGLSLSSKLVLSAVLARFRRTGLQESVLGDIVDETKRIVKMSVDRTALQFLYTTDFHSQESDKGQAVGRRQAPRVSAIGAAAVELMEAGILGLETRKGDRGGKLRLCIGEEDVKQALKDDSDLKGIGF